jgi:hypothetical protein
MNILEYVKCFVEKKLMLQLILYLLWIPGFNILLIIINLTVFCYQILSIKMCMPI